MARRLPLQPCRAAPRLLAALLLAGTAQAQDPGATVTVTGRATGTLGIGGFPGQPLARAPLQGLSVAQEERLDRGVATLGGLTLLDASVGDAYNAEGYWAILAVRGYTLDNRFNYRRDGLPINAETAIALDNKDRLELLKGTSGIQAGTSAPGGLVNLVVKRPGAALRDGRLEWRQSGTLLTSVDLAERFGSEGALGLRVNAAYEHLDPSTRDTQGHRALVAAAADWQPGPDTLLQAEAEWSRQQQPSVAGFSLLGDAVPDAGALDLRVNLNRQPWNRSVVMEGTTASLRWKQRLAADWQASAHAMTQRLRSDDRTAFPYGVYDASYDCPLYCDRFAPDGRFSYWQYVSDDERRTSDALEFALDGRARTGPLDHAMRATLLLTRYRARLQDQVFDLARDPSGNGDVGLGRVDGSLDTLPSLGGTDANTNRDEQSVEASLQDVVQLGRGGQLWIGLRHTRLERESWRTSPDGDGSLRATEYTQSATTPWLALALEFTPGMIAYASWGEGLESDVAPNRARYLNRGAPLPSLKSRQVELGLKHDGAHARWSLAAFDIDRPQAADLGPCDVADSCLRAIDGSARHRGLEAQAAARWSAWSLQGSAMWLDAERQGSSTPSINGARPINVPSGSLRLAAGWRPPAWAGLELQGALTAEGDRVVTHDAPGAPGLRIPGWSRIDLGARWTQHLDRGTLTWRVGLDNALDRRAWKESPTQFGHVYLYPLAPRTWRASLEVAL
jgi:iron complex outermembrane receptor protein